MSRIRSAVGFSLVSGETVTGGRQHRVKDDTGVAYTQACHYADGTNVLCATVIALDGGVISSQTVLETWDEA